MNHPTHTVAQRIGAVLGEHIARGGIVLGDDVHAGGLGGCTQGLPVEGMLDVPVGSRSALGLGLGMALAGTPVVVEVDATASLDPSVLRDAVRASGFTPTLVIRVASGGEAGVLDAAFAVEGLSVWASSEDTADRVLAHCLKGGVHLILESRTAYGRRAAPVDFAPVVTHRQGSHATLATWGNGVHSSLEAAEALAAEGIDVAVVELVQLAPVPAALNEAVVATGRLVVAHPGAPELAEVVQRRVLEGAFLYLESPLTRCDTATDAVARAVRDSVWY